MVMFQGNQLHQFRFRSMLLLFLVLPGIVVGQTTLSSGVTGLIPDGTVEEQLRLEETRKSWDLQSIAFALENGFHDVAQSICERLLSKDLDTDDRALVLNYLLQIALVRGDLGEAVRLSAEMTATGFSPDPLKRALLAYFSDELDTSETILEQLDPESLSSSERAWRELLNALILEGRGEHDAANESFQLAERLAPSSYLRDHFEIIRQREELSDGALDDGAINSLRDSVRSMRGERGGFEAARLLAMALNRSGQTSDAIEVLNLHLEMPGLVESGLRPDFLFLLGLVAGPESTRGRLALRQLVSEGQGNEVQSLALALLASSTMETGEIDTFQSDLANWLQVDPPHPMTDRLLAYQGYLYQLQDEIDAAESSATRLLQEYPSSNFLGTALGIMAYTSWNQTPPRYRTAAEYLNRQRDQLTDPPAIIQAGILIADSYYLNGDFDSASEAYGAVLMDATPGAAQSIFFQQVQSELNAGDPIEAADLVDAGYRDQRLTMETIWKAEWNLLDYLRREGRLAEAFSRMNSIMEMEGDDPSVSDDLMLRMRWVSARLTLEAGEAERALGLTLGLIEDLPEFIDADLPQDLVEEVESHLLLLLGEIQFAIGDPEEASIAFLELRERFPDSGPTILSYLVESRVESGEDNLVSAQQSLIDLVDQFPASEYAPIALWEAALNAEQRGLNSHLQEAISILERLVTEYPDHGLVYYARLKQGDLARKLNDFPTALLLYERLLALYPGHPERFRAELSRGDCLMALGSEDPSRFDVAAIIYEKNCLLTSVPLPIRMESGYKWANSLSQQNDNQGAESVFLLLYERFILDPDMNQQILSEDAGRYWMARVLLEMGSFQSEKGEIASAITIYQTLISLDLPGSALAQSRLETLR